MHLCGWRSNPSCWATLMVDYSAIISFYLQLGWEYRLLVLINSSLLRHMYICVYLCYFNRFNIPRNYKKFLNKNVYYYTLFNLNKRKYKYTCMYECIYFHIYSEIICIYILSAIGLGIQIIMANKHQFTALYVCI